MRPMLATRGTRVPTGDGWVHEVKWDGMRIMADVGPERLTLTSRNENVVTASWPELAGLGRSGGVGRSDGLGRDMLLDGEVVVLDDGRPSFGALAERMHVRDPRRVARFAESRPATYLIFDIVRLDGEDLSSRPLSWRREQLTDLGLADVSWQVSDTYDDGAMLFDATREQRLEGIVSKRLSSRYEYGARSAHWLKFAHRARTSWVIGGWRPETGSEHRLGAVLVGEPTPDGLLFRGRVGSGIAGRVGPLLKELLQPLARADSPFFDEVPKVDAAGTHWVNPMVVVDVESLGIGTRGRLRQPAYRGVRDDLEPEDLIGKDQT